MIKTPHLLQETIPKTSQAARSKWLFLPQAQSTRNVVKVELRMQARGVGLGGLSAVMQQQPFLYSPARDRAAAHRFQHSVAYQR